VCLLRFLLLPHQKLDVFSICNRKHAPLRPLYPQILGNQVPAQSAADFAGEWQSDPSYYSGFVLILEQNGSQITGYHSAVSQEGNRIDTSIPDQDRPTIYGRADGNVAKVTFNSSYGNGRGDATLLLEGSKLTWVITRDNGGVYFLPKEAPMYKTN
jgi:hypothetical protein